MIVIGQLQADCGRKRTGSVQRIGLLLPARFVRWRRAAENQTFGAKLRSAGCNTFVKLRRSDERLGVLAV